MAVPTMSLKRSSLTLPHKFLLIVGIGAQNPPLRKSFPDPQIRRGRWDGLLALSFAADGGPFGVYLCGPSNSLSLPG